MRRFLILVVLLLSSGLLSAEEEELHVLIFGSNAVDYAVTREARARGLRETSPLLGQSFAQETAVKTAMTAVEMYGVHRLYASGRRREAVVVTTGLVAINLVSAGIGLHNMRKR